MKGQSSSEMITMTAIALIFFSFALVWYIANNIEINKSSKILKAKELCREISDTINSVNSAGNNAIIKFILPSRLDSTNYNLTIFALTKLVYVAIKDGDIYCSTLTPNVTNGTDYNFTLKAGNYAAKNIRGVVNISAT